MTAEIVEFTGNTIIPEDPVSTLEKAKSWGLTRVLICGLGENGDFVFGGSHSEIAETLMLAEMAKTKLIEEALAQSE